MEIQKKVLTCMICMIVICLAGCQGDDEETYFNVPAENVFTQIQDSVRVDFRLINEQGDTTTVFRKGEDIIFDLKVTNHSSNTHNIGLITNLFTNNLFRVFNEDGCNIGMSFHYPDDMVGDGDIISGPGYELRPGSTYHCLCSWKGNKDIYTYAPFHYNDNIPTLHRGRYYSIAKIRLGYKFHEPDKDDKGLIFICSIHFTIE